jgi:hypothetical protein
MQICLLAHSAYLEEMAFRGIIGWACMLKIQLTTFDCHKDLYPPLYECPKAKRQRGIGNWGERERSRVNRSLSSIHPHPFMALFRKGICVKIFL